MAVAELLLTIPLARATLNDDEKKQQHTRPRPLRNDTERRQSDEGSWALMKPIVFGEIMDFFAEGKPVMLSEPVVTDTTIFDDDDEVVAMIKELLSERVSERGTIKENGRGVAQMHESWFEKRGAALSLEGCVVYALKDTKHHSAETSFQCWHATL